MKNKGFTLVELLVVIFIISLLLTIVMINYRSTEKYFTLQRSAHRLTQEIRNAQQNTMSMSVINGSIPNGYGIYFTKQGDNYDIYLYADIGEPFETYDPSDSIVDTIYKETDSVYLEKEIPSAQLVKIKDIKVNGNSANEATINFKPPDPSVKLMDGNQIEYSTITIILALKNDEEEIKVINVNKAGLIEITS